MRSGRRDVLRWIAAATTLLLSKPGTAASLTLPANAIADLRRLKATSKFGPEVSRMYKGVLRPERRARAEAVLNGLLDTLLQGLPTQPTKEFVLGEFTKTLATFDLVDTEDRERACLYLEEIMDIVGLESSDGLLNRWMYGFDPP